MTISAQYRTVVRALAAVSGEPEAEARELMAHVYGLPPGRLLMRFFDDAEHDERIAGLTEERLSGRPLAYITGIKNFYGLDFMVDERVLIPRFDTESVAEAAIDIICSSEVRLAVDLCCGSGCIGLTLLANTGLDEVLFADVSKAALQVARENAERLGLAARARFAHGDFLDAVSCKADIIVCNPPYISAEEYPHLETQVRDYEPMSALVAGENGLQFYRRLAEEALPCLSPGGTLIAEVGDGQADKAGALLSAAGFVDVTAGTDLSGRPRFIVGKEPTRACRIR